MIEVRSGGQVYRFPDGTSKEEMKAAIDRDLQKRVPPVPQPSMPPEAVPKPYEPPISRGTMVGTGGMIGATLGAPAGPVGILGGGAAGAGVGSGLHDFMRATSHYLMPERVPPMEGGIFAPSRRAAGASLEDAMYSAGFMSAGPVIKATVKPALGKVFGVFSKQAKDMFDLARRFRVDLGTAHLSPRKWVRGIPRVLGFFPFVGTPFRQGQARVVGQLDRASADILNTLAPTSTMFESAQGMTEAAAKRFKWNSRIGAAFYKKFYRLAERLDIKEIVPSQPIREAVEGIEQRVARETVELTTGQALRKPGVDTVGEFVEQLKNLPDRLTVEQARGLERSLNEIVSEGTKQGWDVSRLRAVKKSLEAAKNLAVDPNNLKALGVPEAQAAEIMGAWKRANSFWHRMMGTFETATAKKFARVDRTMFNTGKAVWKAGSKEADEIYRDVFSTKSIDAIQNLREVVGKKEFNRAARVYMDDIINASRIKAKEGALVEDLFSAADFEKRLGLNTKEGRAIVTEMLQGTGVTIKQLDDFVSVAKRATDIVIRDPSTFLTRRIILMGGGGIVGGVAVGGGKVGLPAAALITYTLNRVSNFMMNPRQLERMTRIMSDSTPDKLRRTLLAQLFVSLEAEDTPEVLN